MIGLMGLDNNGTLYAPKGRRLFRVPLRLGMLIQRIQHWVSRYSY
jgi:hypothetical protein